MNKLLLFFILFSVSGIAQEVDTFRIVKQKPKTEKKIESGDPFVTLGGKKGGAISVLEAKNSCCLIISRSDFRVLSFQLSINEQGDMMTYKGAGNVLTTEMIAALGKLKPGAMFTTEEIKAIGTDDIPRKLYPLYFKIKP
jgi:hypothetical protein